MDERKGKPAQQSGQQDGASARSSRTSGAAAAGPRGAAVVASGRMAAMAGMGRGNMGGNESRHAGAAADGRRHDGRHGLGMDGRQTMGGMGGGSPDDGRRGEEKLKTLTRTDFLLQFVWKPPKPEEQPKTEEEAKAKIKEMVDKMTEAEKNNPAVTMPKVEDLQAASLKKSEELDAKIQKASAHRELPAGPGPGALDRSAPAGAARSQAGWHPRDQGGVTPSQ